jgi:hypothetical protein
MNKIVSDIQNLIDKLKIAEKIYTKASSRVHDQPMTNQMKALAERKNVLLEDLTRLLEVDMDKHKVQWKDRIKVEWEKLGIELDHIIIRINEGTILSFCIKREEELIDMYKKVLNNDGLNQYDELIRELFQYQLNESIQLLDELGEKKQSYNF